MKIVFMGTPAFSVPALDALVARHDVVAVYAQPPRPAGRGQAPRPGPVAARAAALGLPVRTPVSLRDAAAQAEFAALGAEVAVVVAYGLILPQAVLDVPRLGCLNIHASLLPRWRGAAPIHRAVMAGDAETGICIMAMEAGLDTGPVLLRQAVPIGAEDTTGDLHDRLSVLGSWMIVEVLEGLAGRSSGPQSSHGVTYATKIDKAEARIDWTRPAVEVDRLIRGLSPAPGAWCLAGAERLRLLRSRVVAGHGAPGQRLSGSGLTVACGAGAVEVMQAQREGKRPMAAAEILRGAVLPDRLT
ncbi:MAG: methionyl-tRNA formyltransferase [Gemmobacter sp.]